MKAPVCRVCGEAHYLWEPHVFKSSEGTSKPKEPDKELVKEPEVRKEVQGKKEVGSSTVRVRKWREANRERQRKYNREYMRRYRGGDS